jgi:hypothetical protein
LHHGIVLIVMLFHHASNVIGGGIMGPLFSGVDYTRFYLLSIGLAWLPAFFLCRPNRWSMGRRMARG